LHKKNFNDPLIKNKEKIKERFWGGKKEGMVFWGGGRTKVAEQKNQVSAHGLTKG